MLNFLLILGLRVDTITKPFKTRNFLVEVFLWWRGIG